MFAVWVANRKRIAAETVGRAEEQALRIAKDAERDAETPQERSAPRGQGKGARAPDGGRAPGARRTASRRPTLEQTLSRRESALAERQAAIERLEKELRARDQALQRAREDAAAAAAAKYEQLVAQQQHELERVAGLTADEAKELLIKQIEGEARHDAANLLKRLDAEARETAVDRAKQYITEAIQRCGAEHAIETTVSVVDLPSDDLKGRIIGREGRNIRALELATGVDLIVDDTPGRDHPVRLRSLPPRDRQAGDRAADRRRPHPPGAHRGGRRRR